MKNPRLRLATAVSGLAIAAVGFVPTSPAQAQPDVKDVQAKVDTLYRQAEQASERYNNAKLELARLRKDVGSLKSDEGRQGAALDQARAQVRSSIIRQYTGSSLSAVSTVVGSQDTSSLLSQMSTLSAYNQIQQGKFADYQTGLKALDIRHDATSGRLAQVAAAEAELQTEKQAVDSKLADAKSLLDRLQTAQRAEILSRSTVRTPSAVTSSAVTSSAVPASGRASAAVQYAMAQVGKAYVYGAAGPSAFDCSGLTMMAWAQAGVALSHSAAAQYSSAPHVAEADLQPGDLVFYYSPISHVGMYIGNGMIVNAENPSVGVAIAPLHMMPYVGAVRPG